MDRIAVTGVNGQIGSALVNILGQRALPLSRAELDLSQPHTIKSVLAKLKPNAIINPAAYTAVDKAESEPELANTINGVAAGVIAEYCAENDIPLVHFSTDYVFNGSGEKPWLETDKTDPVSAYGHSKLMGEYLIEKQAGKSLILRTSWVYDASGKNFLNTMLRLGADRAELKVVADQFGAPCYAPILAEYSLTALEKAIAMPVFPSGKYHFALDGITNWHVFACKIFELAKMRGLKLQVSNVIPIKSEEYPTPAKRPLNSRMNMGKFNHTFGLELPHWQEALEICMGHRINGFAPLKP